LPNVTTILPLESRYRDAAFAVLTREFVSRSQPHRALAIELDEYRDHLWPGFLFMVDQGHSFVAVDTHDEVIGCLVACDYCVASPPVPTNAGSVRHKMAPLLALLATLDRHYREQREPVVGQTLLVDMAVVSPQAAGGGVYRHLREAAHDHARRCGFTRVVGELSSAATQHVCVNIFRHQVKARISFASFVYQGTRPFAALTDPPDVVLVEGEL
jgi:GNAT superfamily N-acetyltransferase